jgi:formate/nitrite transporter FocA (FNT family)
MRMVGSVEFLLAFVVAAGNGELLTSNILAACATVCDGGVDLTIRAKELCVL